MPVGGSNNGPATCINRDDLNRFFNADACYALISHHLLGIAIRFCIAPDKQMFPEYRQSVLRRCISNRGLKSLLATNMAEDSRDSSSSQEPGSHVPASTPSTDPKKLQHEFPQSQVGKLWDAFGNPDERVNVLANASYKPQGKDPKDVSYSDVVGSVSMSEIFSFYKAPCARESLLTGIGAGFGIGGVRGIFGGTYTYSS